MPIPPNFAQTQLAVGIAQSHPKIDDNDAPRGAEPPRHDSLPGGTQISPPPPGLPPNHNVNGGTLSSSDTCNSGTSHLTALVPPDNSFSDHPELADYPLLTISEHPNFVFYVPYEVQEIRYAELSIAEWPDDEVSQSYSKAFGLPQAPGIIRISLSTNSEFTLDDGKDYIWSLKIYCAATPTLPPSDSLPGGTLNSSENSGSDYVIVRGIIRKIPATAEAEALVNAYEPEIWYDSIARLTEQFQSASARNDSALRTQWFDLLNLLELADLDPETLTPDLVKAPIILR
ncbi:MAG: DUF928 domain-containing protein [Cyanobacteria bacterium J06639_14]